MIVFLIMQLAFPGNYVTPRTYIGTREVGFKSLEDLRKQLAAEAKDIEIGFDSKQESIPATETGIITDVDATMRLLPTVKTTDRLIPFKPLYKAVKKDTIQPVIIKDDVAIKAFAKATSERLKKDPINATAKVSEKRLIITKDVAGSIYNPESIEDELRKSNPFSGESIKLSAQPVPAATQEKDLLPLNDEFKRKTTQALTVRYGDTKKTVDSEILKTWLAVTQDQATGKWSLGLDAKVVDEHILTWAKEYNIAPGITQVSYYDDVITSQTNGASGRALNAKAIKDQLNKWLEAPTSEPLVLATSILQAKVVATRTYSRSSAQLQAKIDAWIASHSGRYQVAIRELGGRGREASHNVAQQTVMASTYKTFLAFVAYRQAEAGALDLNAILHNGKSIEHCIDIMIVVSDNDCAIKLGQHIGWAKVDEIIAAAGFQGIRLNNYNSNGQLNGDKLVNASEQAKFLAQLSGNLLISSANTDKLLGYMKRQTYRKGIPTGSRGAVVADKVGFLDAYIHDVGIVYGAKSTYALVIMSEGSSWTNIKDLAQAVYDFMNE